MEAISLPLLLRETTIDQALAAVKMFRRSGVVLQKGKNKYSLIWTGSLLEAKDQGINWLEEIKTQGSILILTPDVAEQYKIDLVRPLSTIMRYGKWFGNIHDDFGLIGADREIAMLVTRHETFKYALADTGGYRCNGPDKHGFPLPVVRVGEICPKCPNPLPGGGVAKIKVARF